MKEKKIALNKILDRCNGNRRMLVNILDQHPGLQIDQTLAKQIMTGELEKAEIYRRVNSGIGIKKSHCSRFNEGREGRLKNS